MENTLYLSSMDMTTHLRGLVEVTHAVTDMCFLFREVVRTSDNSIAIQYIADLHRKIAWDYNYRDAAPPTPPDHGSETFSHPYWVCPIGFLAFQYKQSAAVTRRYQMKNCGPTMDPHHQLISCLGRTRFSFKQSWPIQLFEVLRQFTAKTHK